MNGLGEEFLRRNTPTLIRVLLGLLPLLVVLLVDWFCMEHQVWDYRIGVVFIPFVLIVINYTLTLIALFRPK
jgi:hypothetical protein